MRMTGTYAIPDAGIEAPLEILKLRPNKYLFRTTFGPLGEIVSGYDGRTAWAVQPGQGAILLDKDVSAMVAEQADFFGDFHDYSRFAKVELAEDGDFEGRRVHRVRMVRASGDTLMEFFDVESGLSGSVTAVRSALGRVETTTRGRVQGDFAGFKVATDRAAESAVQARHLVVTVDFDT
jgi:hypothetical protein